MTLWGEVTKENLDGLDREDLVKIRRAQVPDASIPKGLPTANIKSQILAGRNAAVRKEFAVPRQVEELLRRPRGPQQTQPATTPAEDAKDNETPNEEPPEINEDAGTDQDNKNEPTDVEPVDNETPDADQTSNSPEIATAEPVDNEPDENQSATASPETNTELDSTSESDEPPANVEPDENPQNEDNNSPADDTATENEERDNTPPSITVNDWLDMQVDFLFDTRQEDMTKTLFAIGENLAKEINPEAAEIYALFADMELKQEELPPSAKARLRNIFRKRAEQS